MASKAADNPASARQVIGAERAGGLLRLCALLTRDPDGIAGGGQDKGLSPCMHGAMHMGRRSLPGLKAVLLHAMQWHLPTLHTRAAPQLPACACAWAVGARSVPQDGDGLPYVMAYRGASGEHPEHSVAAYREAIRQGEAWAAPWPRPAMAAACMQGARGVQSAMHAVQARICTLGLERGSQVCVQSVHACLTVEDATAARCGPNIIIIMSEPGCGCGCGAGQARRRVWPHPSEPPPLRCSPQAMRRPHRQH